MTEQRTALVLGATGGIGGETARALHRHGWQVRGMARDVATARRRLAGWGIDWVGGDAMAATDVMRASQGVQIIVHAVNPPGYRNWAGTVLPMLDNTIAAARTRGARVVLPGTIYNYRPREAAVLTEATPQATDTRKGAIRIEMERRLRADGLRSLIVRAGDFFGAHAGNSWFAQGLVKPGRPLKAVTYPGVPDAGHAWAYLPDVAEAIARLLDREGELTPAEVFHFGGHWFERGIDMARAVVRVAGHPLPIRRFPWWLLHLTAPVVPLFRELAEMRYLWQVPVRLDNRRLADFLGTEPHTPLDQAVRETLAGLGCLNAIARP